MSDTVQCVSIFLLVLSPLYIPIAVTVVGAVTDWREAARTESRATAARSYPAVADADPQPLVDNRYLAPMAPETEAA